MLILLGAAAAARLIQPQAHGFNDLDYAKNLVRRGVRWFKFDIAPATFDSCAQYSTWDRNESSCQNLGLPQHTCCLGMRGDTSGIPHFSQPFNTTDQFITMLVELRHQFREDAFIALNFQYNAPLAKITTAFWNKLLNAVERYQIRVTIATGSDSFVLQYDELCAKGQCTAAQKKVSDSGIVLQSSSMKLPQHSTRYRNFNTPFQQVDKFCKDGFPEWLDQYHQYPMIFWEPSAADDIQHVASLLSSPDCKLPKYYQDRTRLAMATNLDPEMFSLYQQLATNDTFTMGCTDQRLTGFQNSSSILVQACIQSGEVKFLRPDYSVIRSTVLSGLQEIKCSRSKCLTIENGSLILRNQNFVATVLEPSVKVKAIDLLQDTTYGYVSSGPGTISFLQLKNTTGGGSIFTLKDQQQVSDLALLSGNRAVLVGSNKTNVVISILANGVFHSNEVQIGTNPRVSRLGDELALVFGNGLCQGSVYFNNNDLNKCTFFKYQQFAGLTNIPGVVNMVRADFYSLLNAVREKRKLSACDREVTFSKVVSGGSQSVLMGKDGAYVAFNGVDYFKQALVTSLFCGSASPESDPNTTYLTLVKDKIGSKALLN